MPAASPHPTATYFLQHQFERTGPFTEVEIRRRAASGEITTGWHCALAFHEPGRPVEEVFPGLALKSPPLLPTPTRPTAQAKGGVVNAFLNLEAVADLFCFWRHL